MLQAVLSGALLGLTSIPHCTAMCGPLAGFACSRTPGRASALRYQLGRSFGYAVAGALAGHAGHALLDALPKGAFAWVVFAALAASSCVLIARMLWRRDASERLVSLRVSPARSFSSRLVRLVPRDPLALGAITALLPCGALAAALLLAATTSAPVPGALLMLGFATTSGPALLIAAVATRALQLRASPLVRRLAAGALVVAALLLMLRPVSALVANPSHHGAPTAHCH
jgi:sulfite exporter TauE/SafE